MEWALAEDATERSGDPHFFPLYGEKKMKTIGLIGGMGWESTAEYYRIINRHINERLGKFHSAKLLMYSVDFQEIEELMCRDEWGKLAEIMVDTAKCLEHAGAGLLAICTNTIHKVAEEVESNIEIPLVHIADSTARVILDKGINKVGLLGTKFTMTQPFYRKRMKQLFAIDVITPGEDDMAFVHKIIFEELVRGKLKDASRERFNEIIERFAGNGAQGVILGCTEIPLLVRQADHEIPLFNTTEIHAIAVAELALLLR